MLVENGGKYNVQLINPNGSRESTIVEIANALDNLTNITNLVFSSVKSRLNEQRQRLAELSSRIEHATDTVNKLQGIQKAIRVVSPANYPHKSNPLFQPLIGKAPATTPVKNPFEQRKTPHDFSPSVQHPDDLLTKYPVHRKQPTSLGLGGSSRELGLGTPPSGIETLDSFLLFNTAENPYQNYRVIYKGERQHHPIPVPKVSKESFVDVSTTPNEIQNGTLDVENDDFYYQPSTLDIPDIDTPDCLPNLPGVAEDFNFSIDLGVPFFSNPSRQSSPARTDTASIQSETSDRNPSGSFAGGFDNGTSSMDSLLIPPKSSDVDDRSSRIPDDKVSKVHSSDKFSSASPIAPPPPPPPPPMDEPSISRPAKPPEVSMGLDDMRSNLMEAIRAAGGAGKAQLRSVKERKYEARKKRMEEKEKSDSNTGDSGDLMADLKNALNMRRKGISGNISQPTKGAGGSSVGGIMQKLASTIPTLEVSSEGFGESDSDPDDWE